MKLVQLWINGKLAEEHLVEHHPNIGEKVGINNRLYRVADITHYLGRDNSMADLNRPHTRIYLDFVE